jgi:hypothetical protein
MAFARSLSLLLLFFRSSDISFNSNSFIVNLSPRKSGRANCVRQ